MGSIALRWLSRPRGFSSCCRTVYRAQAAVTFVLRGAAAAVKLQGERRRPFLESGIAKGRDSCWRRV